ncbi:hypothetical protein [Tenacibaculum ovolyticum]|uniref:hypothetical protein n=1 Tax=Tenacibaculum ovolyticum TaxID=104270 RepID=UPI0004016850|nr:hypothetical protein [Tenacibaculum ovolyticum]
MIIQYANNVFTHDGQSTVVEFGKEINTQPIKGEIEKVDHLKVYTGYHGTAPQGNWCRDFDSQEKLVTEQIAKLFPKAKLEWYIKPGMTDQEIRDAYNAGAAFFTWCDSNNKIKSVMGI